jgi:hypothetical protein
MEVKDRSERMRLGLKRLPKRSRCALLRKGLIVLLAGYVGLLGGCISGLHYGGNDAFNLASLESRGHEATGWLED